MRSNPLVSKTISFGQRLALATLPLVFLYSCAQNFNPDSTGYTGAIGEKLTGSSALSDSSGQADRTQMVFFDKTVRRIHHFDLTTMKMIKSLTVDNPDAQHSVIFDQNLGLIVDFSVGHLTLFDRDGVPTKNPVQFAGKPTSAAYRASTGTLAVYDDLSNVAIFKFDANGRIAQKWMGGSLLDSSSGATIECGDLNNNDELILALSDGKLAVVDLAQTLATETWAFRTVATGLTDINWIAPVRGSTDLMMALSKNGTYENVISTVSLADGSANSVTTTGSVVIASKNKDPHVIVRENYSYNAKMYYATASGLASPRTLSTTLGNVFDSRLSIAENSWTVLEGDRTYSWEYRNSEYEFSNRVLKRYRFSDMLALPKSALPDKADLSASSAYVVALYPSELGLLERISISDGSKQQLKLFNLGHL